MTAALLLACGCASTPARTPPLPRPGQVLPRIALVPLENLTGKADASVIFTRIVFVELVRCGRFEVVESGIVDSALAELRIRDTGSLTVGQIAGLGGFLEARYLMVGSALEDGVARTPDGDVPSVGMALKLLDVASGRVLWADMRFRTGDDRETVFGWGRENDPQKLAASLATDMIQNLTFPQPRPAAKSGSGGGE